MSILKKIKSAFIVEEGTSAPEPKHVDSAETETVPVAEAKEANYQSEKGEVNQKFSDILFKAIEAHNQEGFDYLEFKRSIQNLAQMNLEEATAFKSAFATAQTMGATPKALSVSAQHYLAVLQKEEEKFHLALANQKAKQIDGGLKELKSWEQSIQDKTTHIEKLKQEITTLQEQMDKLKSDISGAEEKINGTERDFMATYQHLVNQIRQDIENIGKYLS